MIQQFWYDYGASATRDKYTYGGVYPAPFGGNRNSNRLYSENNVTAADGALLPGDPGYTGA